MNLFDSIAKSIGPVNKPGSTQGWTSLEKAYTYACMIVALRSEVSIEVGVWHGRGSIAMGLAHKEIGRGVVYAVDAWEASASIEGQIHPADQKHWNNQPEHDKAKATFQSKIAELGLYDVIKVAHTRSLDFKVPDNCGLIVLDGNHGETTISDVAHYAPNVKRGGFVYMDDLDWSGGAVKRASENLKQMGFEQLYRFETGAFFQRI